MPLGLLLLIWLRFSCLSRTPVDTLAPVPKKSLRRGALRASEPSPPVAPLQAPLLGLVGKVEDQGTVPEKEVVPPRDGESPGKSGLSLGQMGAGAVP